MEISFPDQPSQQMVNLRCPVCDETVAIGIHVKGEEERRSENTVVAAGIMVAGFVIGLVVLARSNFEASGFVCVGIIALLAFFIVWKLITGKDDQELTYEIDEASFAENRDNDRHHCLTE